MTKREKWIDLRAAEIWAEHYYSDNPVSELKALSQAAREWREKQQKTKKVRLF
jgi:hypothetical protein